jgi:hypothetical protein
LQQEHAEPFEVSEKDGVERRRPDVRAARRVPVEKAARKWIAARGRFYATRDDDDRAAAIEALDQSPGSSE